jgi:hypothetical protein
VLLLDKNIETAGEVTKANDDDCIALVITATPNDCYNFIH